MTTDSSYLPATAAATAAAIAAGTVVGIGFGWSEVVCLMATADPGLVHRMRTDGGGNLDSMNQNRDEGPDEATAPTEPALRSSPAPDAPAPDAPAVPAPEAGADRPGRLFRLRSLIAVGVAGVIVGGLGGATTAALASDEEPRHRDGRFERGFPGGPGQPRSRD